MRRLQGFNLFLNYCLTASYICIMDFSHSTSHINMSREWEGDGSKGGCQQKRDGGDGLGEMDVVY